jgi:hypothetical protein
MPSASDKSQVPSRGLSFPPCDSCVNYLFTMSRRLIVTISCTISLPFHPVTTMSPLSTPPSSTGSSQDHRQRPLIAYPRTGYIPCKDSLQYGTQRAFTPLSRYSSLSSVVAEETENYQPPSYGDEHDYPSSCPTPRYYLDTDDDSPKLQLLTPRGSVSGESQCRRSSSVSSAGQDINTKESRALPRKQFSSTPSVELDAQRTSTRGLTQMQRRNDLPSEPAENPVIASSGRPSKSPVSKKGAKGYYYLQPGEEKPSADYYNDPCSPLESPRRLRSSKH